ncbi:ABC transporter [Sporanaerobium hydrogeniformans]|uniref:ABC transporter n=1 Tax=Sporanaerobium hydrogeniformans TaxID=3072179 RepID=A0AC61DDT7_9FIRM|nr:ABC transporter ATP-binding protein [Sporanaerobium hydrogeniformans]PHV70871.1 ABC transporter [Sporanaerobium hydrogeniformans]
MIEINDACKSFGTLKALDHVSIKIPKGCIYGVIGENGAGKSTLIQALVGIYTLDEGSILIEGQPVYENNEVKRHLGYVADRNQFFKGYTVKQMMDFFDLAYPSFSVEKFEAYNKVFKLKKNAKVKNLSKGMQMRLAIMLNIAIGPRLLVLDEPTSGLDAIAKKQVLDLIISEVEESGMTVVISSHHLAELERICDEVTILNQGKVAYQSTVDDLKAKVKKLQVVFEEKAPEDLGKWPEIVNLDHVGSVYYIVTDQYSHSFEDKLRKNGARLIEPIGLNLEEVFIYTSTVERIEGERGKDERVKSFNKN